MKYKLLDSQTAKHCLSILSLTCVLIIISACANDKQEFSKAKQNNTIEGYQSFIQNFPSSSYTENATQAIDSLLLPIQNQVSKIGNGKRYNFGNMYKGNMVQTLSDKDGKKREFSADLIAQEEALKLVINNRTLHAETQTIQIYKKLVFSIPDSLRVDNSKMLLRPKEILIADVISGFFIPADDTEIPVETGINKTDKFYIDNWSQAIGASLVFQDSLLFETKNHKYKITSIPASIKFTKYGVELINIKKIKK